MNILLIHPLNQNGESYTFGAVSYYRMQKPHEVLSRLYTEFDYFTADNIRVPEHILKQADLVLFQRVIPEQEDIDFVERLGIPWGVDEDDYWDLYEDHLLYHHYKEDKTTEKIKNTIKQAHFVICTTEILADKISQLNKNVHVIENGVDTRDKAWQPNKIKSNRIRFGFTQGTTHVPDIMEINKSVQEAFSDPTFYNKGQVVLCGFNAKFNEPSVYVGYERLLTNNLDVIIDLDYKKRLKKISNPNGKSHPYKRVYGVDVENFGYIHNELDVVVAPLKSNEFNSCKSNIKMLEAGFMDCAVMVHNVSPYKELMTKDNCFNLSEKTFNEWQKIILKNPLILQEKTLSLKESVRPFELSKLTDKRKQLYESLSN